jgi:hypothetical protein
VCFRLCGIGEPSARIMPRGFCAPYLRRRGFLRGDLAAAAAPRCCWRGLAGASLLPRQPRGGAVASRPEESARAFPDRQPRCRSGGDRQDTCRSRLIRHPGCRSKQRILGQWSCQRRMAKSNADGRHTEQRNRKQTQRERRCDVMRCADARRDAGAAPRAGPAAACRRTPTHQFKDTLPPSYQRVWWAPSVR